MQYLDIRWILKNISKVFLDTFDLFLNTFVVSVNIFDVCDSFMPCLWKIHLVYLAIFSGVKNLKLGNILIIRGMPICRMSVRSGAYVFVREFCGNYGVLNEYETR